MSKQDDNTDKASGQSSPDFYLTRPSCHTAKDTTRWIVWKDCILRDMRALYTCNMSVAGVCLTDLSLEESIEWIGEFNKRHLYEDRCVFGITSRPAGK